MNRKLVILLAVVFMLTAVGLQGKAYSDDNAVVFPTSLHKTARGMSYWYDSAQGGLDIIMNVPYEDYIHPTQGCANCHNPAQTWPMSCTTCHGVENPTGPPPGTPAEIQTQCLLCHAREGATITQNNNRGTPDVHLAAGIMCADCHTSREIHGDGTEYLSLREPGVFDVSCESCHVTGDAPAPPSDYSHNTHTETLNCNACHQQRVVSCYNCHMDTAAPYGAGVRVAKGQIADWVYLINYNGKVTSANMQTFVGGDPDNMTPVGETALMFAPVHSHSVMSTGRTCTDCHATVAVKTINRYGTLDLTWLDVDGVTLKNQTGVIPVAANTSYNFIAYDKDNTVTTATGWVTLSDVPEVADLEMFGVAFGEPLTSQQMMALAKKKIGGNNPRP